MFDWLIPLLIVIILVIVILDYIGLFDLLSAVASLIGAAIGLMAEPLVRLVRRLIGGSKPRA